MASIRLTNTFRTPAKHLQKALRFNDFSNSSLIVFSLSFYSRKSPKQSWNCSSFEQTRPVERSIQTFSIKESYQVNSICLSGTSCQAMRGHGYSGLPAERLASRDGSEKSQRDKDTKSRSKAHVRYQENRSMCSQRLCAICLTLIIAVGAVTIIMFSTFYYDAEKEQEVFKRALSWITENEGGSDDSEETFPYDDIRLPKDIIPLNYKLYMHPDLKTFNFTGRATIEVRCVSATKYIVLHAKKLEFSKYAVRNEENNEIPVTRMVENEKHEQILLETENKLNKNQRYVFGFSFRGRLSNKMAGFYKSSYSTKAGDERHLATTQFESTDARAAFPCFDEPEFKAKFTVTMVHDRSLNAISNMPLDRKTITKDGLVESHFMQSVKMSTYLVAFVVSDFGFTETTTKTRGIKIRVWAKKDALNETLFGANVAASVLDYYEEFFGIPYPLPKMDLVAVPDFAAGAMENWGLVTFRETYLLNNPKTSNAADKQTVAIVIAHELAHQWFGNLVTMKWWKDLWLNEGFANYVEYIGANHFAKDWRMPEQFVADTLQNALELDSMSSTHPISVDVYNPGQITEIFDGISYDKGSSVIRMLRNFLGDEKFKKGLNNYLKNHAYANAEADDLWKALSKVSTGGLNVKPIMDSWIAQKGYPVVTLKTGNVQKRGGSSTIVAEQQRFLRDVESEGAPQKDEMESKGWYIPLTYISSDSPKEPTKIWMNRTSARLTLPNPSANGWIKANVGQFGFYRVNYGEGNWKKLIQQLKTDHTVLSSLDRSGLIDDAFSMTRAGMLDLTTALQFTEYLDKEREYIPWTTALSGLSYIGAMLTLTPSYGDYSTYILNKVKPIGEYVGWQNRGNIMEMYLRNEILSTLCAHGDPECVKICLTGFRGWMKNDSLSISPHIRTMVYHTAVKYGGQEEWNFLWNKYEKSIDATEKGKIMYALAGSREPYLLQTLLDYSLDDNKIRTQDMVGTIGVVSSHVSGRLLAWDFVRQNFNKIIKRIGKSAAMELGYIVGRTTGNFNTEYHLNQVKEWVAEHKDILGDLRATKKAFENIRANIVWMKKHKNEVDTWLQQQVQIISKSKVV